MKISEKFMFFAMIVWAPHMPKDMGVVLGCVYAAISFLHLWKSE